MLLMTVSALAAFPAPIQMLSMIRRLWRSLGSKRRRMPVEARQSTSNPD
jgi:hypothetical protein